jgi:hypothetical protein
VGGAIIRTPVTDQGEDKSPGGHLGRGFMCECMPAFLNSIIICWAGITCINSSADFIQITYALQHIHWPGMYVASQQFRVLCINLRQLRSGKSHVG